MLQLATHGLTKPYMIEAHFLQEIAKVGMKNSSVVMPATSLFKVTLKR